MKFLLVISLALLQMVYLCCCAPATNQMETVPTVPEKTSPSKRSLIGFRGFENGEWPGEWNQFGNPWNGPSQPSHNSWSLHKPVPSQMEVSSAIAEAKQASENVLIAQQQMVAAKESVLQQQKLASEREANAQIAQQKLASIAALQRSESAAAAQGVILAQQRLAATKAALAHHQKIASVKEAHAAESLRSSAHAAAIEIQRTENEAEKLSTIHRNGEAASLHHVAATKDALLAPIIIGSNRVPGGTSAFPFGPWSTQVVPTPGMTRAFANPLSTLPAPQYVDTPFLNPRNAPLLWG